VCVVIRVLVCMCEGGGHERSKPLPNGRVASSACMPTYLCVCVCVCVCACVSIRVFVCMCEREGTKDLSHCPTDVWLALLARLFVCVCVRVYVCMCVDSCACVYV